MKNELITITLPNGTKVHTTTDDNGFFDQKLDLNVGQSYNITLTYDGNSNILPINTTITITPKKAKTTTNTITNGTTTDNFTLTINITNKNQNKLINEGQVHVYSNNSGKLNEITNYILNNANPMTLNFVGMNTGIYNFFINFTGTNNYLNSNTTLNNIQIGKNATITITTLNDTYSNTTIKVVVTDEKNTTKKVDNGNITITLPDRSNKTISLTNGEAIVKVNLPASTNSTINVTYNGDNTYTQTSNNISICPTKQNTIITPQINNITPNNTTITIKITDETGKPITNGTITITLPNGTKTTTSIKNNTTTITITTNPGKQNISITYNGDDNNNPTTKTQTITIPKHNSTLTVNIPTQTYVGENNISGILKDTKGNSIKNAPITIIANNKTYTTKTDNNGKYNLTIEANSGSNNIIIKYPGNNNYSATTKTLKFNASKLSTIVTVDNVQSIIGNKFTLTAHVKDQFGNLVKSGKLVFKVNGLTLKENGQVTGNSNPLILQVINGTATTTIEANLYLRRAQNITATYAGTSRYYENTTQKAGKMAILLRNASIVVTTKNITNQDTNLLLTAHIYDITNGKRESLRDYEDNYVIFKVNGITIKDAQANALKAKVINGVATLNYTVPAGLAGIYTNKTNKYYTVLAIFASGEYYPTAKNTTQFTVNRSGVSFNKLKVTYNEKTREVLISALLQDYHKNMPMLST